MATKYPAERWYSRNRPPVLTAEIHGRVYKAQTEEQVAVVLRLMKRHGIECLQLVPRKVGPEYEAT